MARLKDAGATIAERAILLEQGGIATAFVHDPPRTGTCAPAAGNDRYYLDPAAYDAFAVDAGVVRWSCSSSFWACSD